MGGSDVLQSYLMEAADWQRIESADVARTGPFILGVDLGTSAAMSAAAGFWPATGRLESLACFQRNRALPSVDWPMGSGGCTRTFLRGGS